MWYTKKHRTREKFSKKELLEKKLQKSSEKGLTNEEKCGIIEKLITHKNLWKRDEKNLQKTSEKGLTNEEKCGIINELSDKKTDNEKASWKLNNQEYENPWKYFELIKVLRSSKD